MQTMSWLTFCAVHQVWGASPSLGSQFVLQCGILNMQTWFHTHCLSIFRSVKHFLNSYSFLPTWIFRKGRLHQVNIKYIQLFWLQHSFETDLSDEYALHSCECGCAFLLLIATGISSVNLSLLLARSFFPSLSLTRKKNEEGQMMKWNENLSIKYHSHKGKEFSSGSLSGEIQRKDNKHKIPD